MATKEKAKKKPAKKTKKPAKKKPAVKAEAIVEKPIVPAVEETLKPDPKMGIATAETRILACQCGGTAFDVGKRTKTAVNLTCMKCGLRSSVKGNIATVRVRQQEISYALANTMVAPDAVPESQEGETAEVDGSTGKKEAGPEYLTLRFRIMKGDQKDMIDRAMEAVRVANCSDDKFREQTWQGHALEWICADFLSGCSHDVLQIVDAMDSAEEDAFRIAKEDGKSEPAARKIRDLRSRVRDKLAEESGILPVEKMDDDARQLDLVDDGDEHDGTLEDGEQVDPSTQVKDGGRLLRAVGEVLEGYHIEAVSADIESDSLPEFIVREGATPPGDLVARWTTGGGYLVRIDGDRRTVDGNDLRPSVCVWIAAEPASLTLDFSMEYDDATDDILGDGVLEIVELLPPDYDEIDQWAAPHFADRREKI